MVNSITVRVPATTSNLGPGYDCLGVALQIYNEVTVRRPARRARVEEHPMAAEAAALFFAASARRAFAYEWAIAGDVPISRGLGSSVTLRLGIMAGLNALVGMPLDRRHIFDLCAQLEGHPDNAAPAAFGGFTACDPAGAPPLRVSVDRRLHFVLLIPDFEVRTDSARSILPTTVPRLAAVISAGRACRIAAAFATRRYAFLRGMFVDETFHQPHRVALVPFLPRVIAAAEQAGALGGFLSGSGSAICGVTMKSPQRVGAAMLRASGAGTAQVLITRADNRGFQIR
jgi:homoserine kinase